MYVQINLACVLEILYSSLTRACSTTELFQNISSLIKIVASKENKKYDG